jgi:arabinogalactan endo-1,4-beta-galactosidase
MTETAIHVAKRRANETVQDLLARYERGIKRHVDVASDVLVVLGLEHDDATAFFELVERSPVEVAAWVDFDVAGDTIYCGWVAWDQDVLMAAVSHIADSLGQQVSSIIDVSDKRSLN